MPTQSAHTASKHPRSILAGPYGHPFHALLVTVPIGSWVALLVFDILTIAGDDPDAFARGARWLLGIGLVGAAAAAVVGFLDYSILVKGTRAQRLALIHMLLNLVIIVLMGVSLLARLGTNGFSLGGFIVSLIGLGMLALSGFIGGELAYRFGVRVADESTQRAAFEG